MKPDLTHETAHSCCALWRSASHRVEERHDRFGLVEGAALFSRDGQYRYLLERYWSTKAGICLWIMLNPSTADAFRLDPTVSRCVGFSQRWGFAGAWIANAFAFRSTDPQGLRKVEDPIGPDNDMILKRAAGDEQVGRIMIAWGVHAGDRGEELIERMREWQVEPWVLGLTQHGAPRHPLYVRSHTVATRLSEAPGR